MGKFSLWSKIMKINKHKMFRNWIYIVVILLLGFSLVGFLVLKNGTTLAEDSIQRFEGFIMEDYKSAVRNEVLNRLEQIEFEQKKLISQEEDNIVNKIKQTAYLLRQYAEVDQSPAGVIDAFETIVSFDTDYLYFALSPEGVLLRSGTDDDLVGVNLIDATDEEGHYFVKDMLKAMESEDGCFVDYYWPREKGSQPIKKTAYCYYIKELDMVIATGYYEYDIQEELKARVYANLQKYYADEENYIFVNDFNSTSRISGNPEQVGLKQDYFLVNNGQKLHDLCMSLVSSQSEGFLTYSYYKKNTDQLSEKISFVKEIEGWHAYMGMGFHTDDLTTEIENYSKTYKRNHYINIVSVGISLFITGILVFILIHRGLFLQMKYAKQEEVIFSQILQHADEAVIILSEKNKIMFKNTLVTHLFGDSLNNHTKKGHLNLEAADDKAYSIKNDHNRTYYVTLKTVDIYYHAKKAKLYFIKDITTQYIEKHRFEELALIDELTRLPNRRKLINDYEDYCYQKKAQSSVFALIDIDHFKKVNDTYGHNIGDEVIKILAQVFNNRLRHSDKFYRYGGEEFVVLLRDTDLELGIEILQSINDRFKHRVLEEHGFECTFSGGVVLVDWTSETCQLNETVAIADKRLYHAKSNGRKQIIFRSS